MRDSAKAEIDAGKTPENRVIINVGNGVVADGGGVLDEWAARERWADQLLDRYSLGLVCDCQPRWALWD